jgi:antitoxin HicB
MKILYPAHITHEPSDNRFTVQFLDLEEAITEGESLEEARFNASEVLTLTLESRMDEKIEIPFPSDSKDADLIAPSARVQAALLIHFAKGGHTTSELARILETSWPAAARLENPHHWPSLKQLERAAIALGQRLIISLEPAN